MTNCWNFYDPLAICSDPISETFIHLDEETANNLLLHEDRVSNDNLNRRKKSTLIREQQLETILEDFSSLNPEQQLNSVIKFSYKIGTIEKFVDLSQNLENSEKYFISTATTEEELDDTIYQTFCDSDSELDSDPESDSESEF